MQDSNRDDASKIVNETSKKLREYVETLTQQIELLSGHLSKVLNVHDVSNEVKEKVAELQSDFKVFQNNIQELQRIVIKGNGKHSLIDKIARIEHIEEHLKSIEEIENRIDKMDDSIKAMVQTSSIRSSYKQSIRDMVNMAIAIGAIALSLYTVFKQERSTNDKSVYQTGQSGQRSTNPSIAP